MRETARAREAWADYLALGPDRSLERLMVFYVERRQSVGGSSAPTSRLRTLEEWSSAFGWQDRLQAIAEREAQQAEQRQATERTDLQKRGMRDRENRVAKLVDLHDRLVEVVDARAEHYGRLVAGEPESDTGPYHRPEWIAPGAATGVLVFTRKVVGKLVTEEWAADVGTLKEIRATQEQIAKELGQWEEKKRLNVEVEKELDDALERLRAQLPPEEYARVLAALATGDAGEG